MDMKDIDKELRKQAAREYHRLHHKPIWRINTGEYFERHTTQGKIFKAIKWTLFVIFWAVLAGIAIYAIAVSPDIHLFLAIVLGVILSALEWIWSTGTALFIAIFSWKGLVLIGFLVIWLILNDIKQILLAIYGEMHH